MLFVLASAGSDPHGLAALKELASIYEEVADVAPGEIKTELEGSRDLFAKVIEATESGATSSPELEAQARHQSGRRAIRRGASAAPGAVMRQL